MAKTFIPKSPWGARRPEERRGTRSFRKYMQFCGMPSVQRNATARLEKKALKKCIDEQDLPKQGRVVRGVMRSLYNVVRESCDY